MRKPQDWAVALIPIFLDDLSDGTVKGYTSWQQTIVIGKDSADEDVRNRFYKALSEITWLPPSIRTSALKQLGSSLSKKQRASKRGETLALRHLINEAKARMRKQGKRKKGRRIHDDAVAEVAEQQGMSESALRKQLQRYK